LVRYAVSEKHVMEISAHPFIIHLHYAFQTKKKLFLVISFCPNGDLSEHLTAESRFSEEKARFYAACILLALEDLHKKNIIFRDLKPENILIDHDGYPILSDFGLSKEGVYETVNGTRSFCGSVAYLAPEMIKKAGHGKAVDWYLLGVVFYEMLIGVPPYYDDDRSTLLNNILTGTLKLPSKLSVEAKNLIISVKPETLDLKGF
jgi:serine/threonine protein kinase